MLPLYMLMAVKGQPIMVELKSGATLNGFLDNCDNWMNLTLKNVVQSNETGDKFFKHPECFVRGVYIKYIQVPDEVLEQVKRAQIQEDRRQQNRFKNHSGPRGRGSNGPRRGGRFDGQHRY